MAEVSAPLRARLELTFKISDVNHNGYLEESDYVNRAKISLKEAGIPEGSELYNKAVEGGKSAFASLLAASDTNKDGKISLEEYVKARGKQAQAFIAAGEDKIPEGFKAAIFGHFKHYDKDADGVLSPAEYATYYKQYHKGASDAEAKQSFDHLAGLDGGKLTPVSWLRGSIDIFTNPAETPALKALPHYTVNA